MLKKLFKQNVFYIICLSSAFGVQLATLCSIIDYLTVYKLVLNIIALLLNLIVIHKLINRGNKEL